MIGALKPYPEYREPVPAKAPTVLSPREVLVFLDAVTEIKNQTGADGVLRRRPAHLRSRSSESRRHRLRPHGAAHRTRQGRRRALSHAVSAAVGGSAFLLSRGTAGQGLAVPGLGFRKAGHCRTGRIRAQFRRSSRNSEAGSTLVTNRWSRARVQAT